jgi:ATP-dependent DNA helicase DinG
MGASANAKCQGGEMSRAGDFFSPGGPLSAALPSYEHRPDQQQMACDIEQSLRSGERLMLEAGTGVGKSLGYIVPLIQWSVKHRKRVVVSTWSRTLQHQIVRRELPLLADIMEEEFAYQLCMGGENYLCERRWELYQNSEGSGLFQSYQYKQLKKWTADTKTGLRSEPQFRLDDETWRQICRMHDFCHMGACPLFSRCFYQRMKRGAQKADILVVNHSLLLSNVRIGSVLPDYDALVVDEAHSLEDVASSYLGDELSESEMTDALFAMGGPNRKGWAAGLKTSESNLAKLLTTAEATATAMEPFYNTVDDWIGVGENQRKILPGEIPELPECPWAELIDMLDIVSESLEDEAQQGDIRSFRSRLLYWHSTLQSLINLKEEDGLVRWAERDRFGKTHLNLVPLEIGPRLRDELYAPLESVALVSATLTVGEDFTFYCSRLGMEDSRQVYLLSPFDYYSQCLFYVPDAGPDPRQSDEYASYLAEQIAELVERIPGGCFVLFTSYDTMKKTREEMQQRYSKMWHDLDEEPEEGQRLLLCQLDMDREMLIRSFVENGRAVLLGAATFWQGLDVSGAALSGIIITRLPFSVPDDPLLSSRMEAMEREGVNSFLNYSVPQAVIMFRQGFGRLIRNQTDHGVVAVLDRRIVEKRYGKVFLDSLPKCYKTHKLSVLGRFFASHDNSENNV